MVKLPKNVIDVLAAPDAPKMIATVDVNGNPNVIPLWSIVALDPETIAFADIFIKKTKENLSQTGKVAIAVCKGNTGYQIKGTFAEFKTSGPVYEEFSKKIMEAMKVPIKSLGIIKVDEVFEATPGKNSNKIV